MAAILLSYQATSIDDVVAHLKTLTHTCGYMRAWVDPIDPLLVWYLQTCPADALITSLKAAVVGFVTNQITANSAIADPYEQVQAIANLALDDAHTWIDANAYTHLAAFLHAQSKLRPFILQEMKNQGIIG